jgi:hypothetical protein
MATPLLAQATRSCPNPADVRLDLAGVLIAGRAVNLLAEDVGMADVPCVLPDHVALHGGRMLDQTDRRGQRRHQRPASVLLGQTAELSTHHMPVILKKPFQQLPLSGGADNFLFGERRV